MFGLPNLSIFLLAAFILLITPGPAVLYIVTRSLDQGRLAGFVSVLSIEVGNLVHVFAATLGLSAILVSSATAFSIIKYLGGRLSCLPRSAPNTYTRYLASADDFPASEADTYFSPRRAGGHTQSEDGFIFFTFLPQFVDSSNGSITLQLLILGCLFVLMTMVTDSLYALLAGTVGQWLNSRPLDEKYEISIS